ncbi:Cytochrome P450 regulator dap1, partial [Pseudocercospora fuligena]
MADSSSADPKQRDTKSSKAKIEEEASLGVLDGLRILAGLLVLNCLLSYFVTGNSFLWNYRPWWSRPNALAAKLKSPVILTEAQLLSYDGSDESLPIYLAVNGTLYDVTGGSGRRIYGPGGPYHVFAGHDAARAYITGCFKDDSVPDYRGAEWTFIPKDVPRFDETADEELSDQLREYRYEMIGKALEEAENAMQHWQKVFRGETGKDYFEVGKISRNWEEVAAKPMVPLCESAEKKRPKSQLEKERTQTEIDKKRQWIRRGRKYKKQYLEISNSAKKEEGIVEKEREEL